MGSSASTVSEEVEVNRPVLGLGVGALVREIGLAMVPVHLKHSYQNIMQIVETTTKLRQFDEAPYNNNLIMLIALLRNAQLQPRPPEPRVQFRGGEGVDFQELGGVTVGGPDRKAQEKFEGERVFGRYATNIYLAS